MPRTRSIAELHKELAAKEGQLAKLRAQRGKLARQLTGIEREIAVLDGRPVKIKRKGRKKVAARKGRRARVGPSLADVRARVMAGKGNVKVAEAAKLARKAGYKSKSGQFGNIVSQTLSGDGRFKKIARGVYALKGKRQTPAKRTTKKVAKKTAKAGRMTQAQQGLGDLLAEVAKGRKLLSIADAAGLALEKGYKSQAKNFQLAVNKALMRDERFGRVGRGIYTLKGQESGTPGKMPEEPAKRRT